ncbi:MAG: phytanoyl-CoA dioxygenase family protein [Chitinophagales bacterium]|nr:phytanoyl-CoA dioxygenase family protein [Chitinophagales bacterium]MDW8274492.1 phytanoyl-CoA dioxygenase family protein [Chitinophagales bacterium]
MRKVFRDEALEQEFQRHGFVTVDLISLDVVENLKQKFFETLQLSAGQIKAAELNYDISEITYDFSFIDKNPEYKRKVFEVLTKELKTYADKYLDNYRIIIANYIRKTPERGGEVPLHQNWAFADELKCCTVSIWIPLIDSTIENGTLQVVPGSHKRFGRFRGPLVPWELEGIKQQIIDKYLVPLETPAGKAVILDDSIVHYSAPNKTSTLRLAIQLICIPEEFPSIHYHKNASLPENVIEVLEVDEEFYIHFNPWKKPEGARKIGEVSFSYEPLTEEEFASRLYRSRFDEAVGNSAKNPFKFFEKLKKMVVG